jgi:spore germination cell wall hydrolase CwlJ-like protein
MIAASVLCLAQVLYYEARSESVEGQLLVAEVVLNRTVSEEFSNSTCGVVYQEGQFSWARDPPEILEEKEWLAAVQLASEILQGGQELLGTEALYFHSGSPEKFFNSRELLGQYGQHTFYK